MAVYMHGLGMELEWLSGLHGDGMAVCLHGVGMAVCMHRVGMAVCMHGVGTDVCMTAWSWHGAGKAVCMQAARESRRSRLQQLPDAMVSRVSQVAEAIHHLRCKLRTGAAAGRTWRTCLTA